MDDANDIRNRCKMMTRFEDDFSYISILSDGEKGHLINVALFNDFLS